MTRWWIISPFLARSANLPEGLYILQMFFLYFFSIFNGWLRNTCISEANRPIFTKISGFVDGCKVLFTSLSLFYFSMDVAIEPIKVEKSAFFPDQSTLSCCHSKTDCNIAILIFKRFNRMNCSTLYTILVAFGPETPEFTLLTINNSFCGDMAKIGISRQISQNILNLLWPTV